MVMLYSVDVDFPVYRGVATLRRPRQCCRDAMAHHSWIIQQEWSKPQWTSTPVAYLRYQACNNSQEHTLHTTNIYIHNQYITVIIAIISAIKALNIYFFALISLISMMDLMGKIRVMTKCSTCMEIKNGPDNNILGNFTFWISQPPPIKEAETIEIVYEN